jgi:RNA polymerase sigma-70 factor, ECF subfamily
MVLLPAPQERELLTAARGGSASAYGALVEPYRAQLQAHCYRMLGSIHDAEDALQETLLRAWRGLAHFEGRSSLRSWLYTIATNACLTVLGRSAPRTLPMEHVAPADGHEIAGRPLEESVWIEPWGGVVEEGRAAPDARYELRESVELAFVAALQHLPSSQRAALILRDVLGFSARETADALDTSVAAANSALQRARQAAEERLPARSQQATLRALGDAELRAIVSGYMEAMERGDVEAVVAMLVEDASWSMPPLSTWYRGHEDLRGFLVSGPLSGHFRWAHRSAWANGQPAVGSYTWQEEPQAFMPFALDVLTLEGTRIAAVTAFIVRPPETPAPDGFAHYPDDPVDVVKAAAVFGGCGLPDRLPG